jgi:hypothetical protein
VFGHQTPAPDPDGAAQLDDEEALNGAECDEEDDDEA